MTFFHTKLKKTLLVYTLIGILLFNFVNCANNNNNSNNKKSAAAVEPEAVIEEVNAKQLEKLLSDKDYVAVFWCKWKGLRNTWKKFRVWKTETLLAERLCKSKKGVLDFGEKVIKCEQKLKWLRKNILKNLGNLDPSASK